MSEATSITALSERQKPKDFPAMLTHWLPEIQRALPKHMSGDRMSRIALTAFRRNPKLGECDPRSVFAAVIQSSQLGLEIDTLGRAYLVPYKVNKKTAAGWDSHMECQLIPGWKGLVDLVNRSGQASVWTGAAFIGDEFDWQLGDSPFVHHKPRDEDDPAKLTHVYAIGRAKGSDWPVIEVWPIEKVWRHRDRYNKVGKAHYSFENQEMYARKIPLLQVLKYLPCSTELATAIAMNDASETGAQNLTVKDAIDGSWSYAENATQDDKPIADGADAVKDALARKESTDKETGEIKTGATASNEVEKKDTGKDAGAPAVDYEKLLAAIKGSADTDALDAHASIICGVDGMDRQNTLAEAYKERRAELTKPKAKK